MNDKPNIFKYATKELSQDAFIFWLLSWADPKYQGLDNDLNQLALKLIQKFFEKNNIEAPKEINFFALKKQEKNIDIVCYVNEFMIIIEDKTRSKAHSNQLIRYIDYAEKKENGKYLGKIIPIFFKTFDQSNYLKEINDGFKIFTRSDILEVLNDNQFNNIENAIFRDFLIYLNNIEDKVNSYKITNAKNWCSQRWTGFYKDLKNFFPDTNWGYVPNVSGGFMGLWFKPYTNTNCLYKLQIEENKLCLKISVYDSENDKKFRERYYNNYLKIFNDHNLHFEKPKRFGKGEHMTILKTEKYLVHNDDGVLDFEKTLENIKAYCRVLDENLFVTDN